MEVSKDYKLFFSFIKKFVDQHFENIDPSDPLILKLEEMLEKNKQFLYVADFTLLNVVYSSKRSLQMLGLEPKDVNPRNIFIKTHPMEMLRHSIGTSKGFRKANEINIGPVDDYAVLSTNHRFLNQQKKYQNQLIQSYVFKVMNPEKNVYGINVHTDISWFGKKIVGFNNYFGKDLSYFRFPDDKLIMEGCLFSKREFEIIKLIKDGLSTDQIAEQLYISTLTVETHRRNILKKCPHNDTKDLIIDLIERGVL